MRKFASLSAKMRFAQKSAFLRPFSTSLMRKNAHLYEKSAFLAQVHSTQDCIYFNTTFSVTLCLSFCHFCQYKYGNHDPRCALNLHSFHADTSMMESSLDLRASFSLAQLQDFVFSCPVFSFPPPAFWPRGSANIFFFFLSPPCLLLLNLL